MTHTPGPWIISGWAIRMSDGHRLASFDMMPDKDDARLIAAAPELLEALETFVSEADDPPDRQRAYKLAKAAIAKAKGLVERESERSESDV